mmetsp:Transcript_21359/g.53272  ORF Transcript_21359/g.53272 Transcript_21359/m.53272 type:complete len:200 (+) Transcript_21359:1501-2100(+)
MYQRLTPGLANDASLLEHLQTFRLVKCVARVSNRLAIELRTETNARQRVERIEKGDCATLEVHRLRNFDEVHYEEPKQEVLRHAGHERIFTNERRHDGLRRHDGHALLEQNLLERPRVVIRMAVRQDYVRHFARRNSVLPQVLGRMRWWINEDAVVSHPKHKTSGCSVSCETICGAQYGDPKVRGVKLLSCHQFRARRH